MRLRMRALTTVLLGLFLTACTSERIIYRPLSVPVGVTQAVQKPLKPDPQVATQKDVGIFIIEQNAAIEACNKQLNIIKNWSTTQNGRGR